MTFEYLLLGISEPSLLVFPVSGCFGLPQNTHILAHKFSFFIEYNEFAFHHL